MNANFVFWFEFHGSLCFVRVQLAASVLVRAWRWTGAKPLPEPMLTQFTDTYAAPGEDELTPTRYPEKKPRKPKYDQFC